MPVGKMKRVGRYGLLVLEIVALFVVALELNVFWLFGGSPSMKSIRNPEVAVASELYTQDGVLIGKYYKENRTPVSFDKLSPNLLKALISTEDVRFYEHWGIDPRSSLSVFWYAAKGDNRGGSTITQQLAKNMFKTRRKGARGLFGYIPGLKQVIFKTKEYLTALKIEASYEKNEILTMYLNTVDLGNNTFGIKVAARNYFNTTPDSLRLEQAALLVGMLKAPSNYNPYRNAERAKERRNVVLAQMVKYADLSPAAYYSLIKLPLGVQAPQDAKGDEDGSYIRIAAQNALKQWAKENDYDIYADGLKIYTTIDSRAQRHAEAAVNEQMLALQRRFNSHWEGQNPWRDESGKEIPDFLLSIAKRTDAYKNLKKQFPSNPDTIQALLEQPKRMRVFTWLGEKDTTFSTLDSLSHYLRYLNCGFMAMEAQTGAIKAWVGGINYKYFKYDHVKQAKRQPGSTFKPFAYLTAIDNGYSPCDKLTDRAVTVRYKEKGEDKAWSPQNADGVFSGREMSLRWAMGRSVNSITAQLTEKIGWKKVVAYAHKMGIESPLDTMPSICLGSSDVSLFEMVRAYSAFANEGLKTEPQLIYKIVDHEGTVLKEFKPKTERVLSEETSFLMRYMLQGGIQEPGGTSQALWGYDVFGNNGEVGGKTGTSSNHSDGWYMGITKDLVCGSWVGASERSIHFRTGKLGEGSKTALPIFGLFLENVYADKALPYKPGKFPKPKVKITKDYICPSPHISTDTTDTDSLEMDMFLDSLPMNATPTGEAAPALEPANP